MVRAGEEEEKNELVSDIDESLPRGGGSANESRREVSFVLSKKGQSQRREMLTSSSRLS